MASDSKSVLDRTCEVQINKITNEGFHQGAAQSFSQLNEKQRDLFSEASETGATRVGYGLLSDESYVERGGSYYKIRITNNDNFQYRIRPFLIAEQIDDEMSSPIEGTLTQSTRST